MWAKAAQGWETDFVRWIATTPLIFSWSTSYNLRNICIPENVKSLNTTYTEANVYGLRKEKKPTFFHCFNARKHFLRTLGFQQLVNWQKLVNFLYKNMDLSKEEIICRNMKAKRKWYLTKTSNTRHLFTITTEPLRRSLKKSTTFVTIKRHEIWSCSVTTFHFPYRSYSASKHLASTVLIPSNVMYPFKFWSRTNSCHFQSIKDTNFESSKKRKIVPFMREKKGSWTWSSQAISFKAW